MSSDGPKSFKDMIFPVPRPGTTTGIYAPLPPSPPPRTVSLAEAERREKQLKEMKKFIDPLRCPNCSAQLDGLVSYEGATLSCIMNQREYSVTYKFGEPVPVWSKTVLYTTHFAYEVETRHVVGELFRNTIFKVDLSLNEKFQQRNKKSILDYEGSPLVIPSNLSEEELIKKIKLYTLFS